MLRGLLFILWMAAGEDDADWNRFFLNETVSVRNASVFVAKEQVDFINRIRPYVVELLATKNTATGIVIGFNDKNQPIILTAGHVLPYDQRDLAQKRHVSLDHPRGERDASIVDQGAHVILPAWKGENSVTSKGWYGLPLFHPQYEVNDYLVLREQKMDFGLYLMTGRTVDFEPGEPQVNEKYKVREALATGFESSQLEPLKTAHLQKTPVTVSTPEGTTVLVMGVVKSTPQSNPQMSFVFSKVLSDSMTERVSKKYALNLDPKIQYFLLGDFEKSMSGAGVFNDKGELVGMITKIVRDNSKKNGVGAIVLDINHIMKNIGKLSTQREVLRVVEDIQNRSSRVRSCSQLF